ncbi:30S ribosomal protein S3 [Candidatus Uhrbacteria bacterium CG10_big_fil_rev_8_21_14_0_10_48_16]|uniref:Small ribosomal subunit protein uS3 n=1 Tax=Candidatus Uhrbacteria bacterium CG10_big_fil_rev_8_21_14_0_10_48_16 TaxID=1975038 RepID=A0A2M8LGR0_9BACT|nr:MAG: 30S ribosomal protein S3 [Candidatus Uhrbacteria bacterium CG10_big_fil_rev_8_21_14_0_10_48_16]
MAQKVHPVIFRIGVIRGWDGVWFANKKNFKTFLKEDVEMREFLKKILKDALIDRIEIERSRQEVRLIVHSAKPGIIIGRGGAGIEDLTKKIKQEFFRGRRVKLSINVKEVQKPSLSAQVIGQQIVADIEKRMPFRRIMKMAIERAMKSGAQGIKITVAGRLNGADIARSETISQGKIPLHNLRSDINYASVTARTIWGATGVKVWINRGEVFDNT